MSRKAIVWRSFDITAFPVPSFRTTRLTLPGKHELMGKRLASAPIVRLWLGAELFDLKRVDRIKKVLNWLDCPFPQIKTSSSVPMSDWNVL